MESVSRRLVRACCQRLWLRQAPGSCSGRTTNTAIYPSPSNPMEVAADLLGRGWRDSPSPNVTALCCVTRKMRHSLLRESFGRLPPGSPAPSSEQIRRRALHTLSSDFRLCHGSTCAIMLVSLAERQEPGICCGRTTNSANSPSPPARC
jgi:hypothetical protein